MGKVWVIAVREYRAIVGTKAFMIALVMMPILMFGGIGVMKMLEGRVGPAEKTLVVLDETGVLFETLAKAAEARNENQIFDLASGKQIKPRYVLEHGPGGKVTEETRLALSQRVRRRELDSVVEIPAEVVTLPAPKTNPIVVPFYAENAAVADERGWLQNAISEAAQTHRLQEAKIDPALIERATKPVSVEPMGLVERTQAGQITKPQQANMETTILIPFGTMMLMWLVIFLAAQPMLESVIEEKGQRIAEVLLGSVNAFQLMVGKLLGGVGGSLTVVLIYGAGICGVAAYYDSLRLVPLRVVPWFLVYQVLAVMLFGSLFMAIGASVNQLKEAQSMLLPVWMIMMIPFFVWLVVVREPMSEFATWLSFFPPATAMMMVLRIGATSAIPWWQPALGIVVLLTTTLLIVFAAARIFRIGFLAQGKAPKLSQLVRWAIRG